MSRSTSGQPRRATGRYVDKRKILLFAEGEKNEEGYLTLWRRNYRDTVSLKIDRYHGAPLSLVKRAVDAKKQGEREEKRGRGRAHDEIWCVFDIDKHLNVQESINLATAHQISLAISNPCIELWFILHFRDQTAFLNSHEAQSAAKKLLGCDKSLTLEAQAYLFKRYADARKRAKYLDTKHKGDDSPPRSNPSSSVWRLIESITNSPIADQAGP